MTTKRRVPVGPQEEKAARRAEALKAAGLKNFEQVYGSTEPGSFDLAEDMTIMEEATAMRPGQRDAVLESMEQPALPVTFDRVDPVPQPRPKLPPQIPVQVEEPPAEEPEVEQLPDDPEKRLEKVAELIRKTHPNGPSPDILRQWKQMHGDIYVTEIESYIFIYRYLKRQEHIQLQANPRINEMQEHQVEEMLFDRCVLWPKMDPITKAGLPAGAMNAIVAQIKMHSMFLDPAYVAQMTVKL